MYIESREFATKKKADGSNHQKSKSNNDRGIGSRGGGGDLAEDDVVGERGADVAADKLKNNAATEHRLGEIIGVVRGRGA